MDDIPTIRVAASRSRSAGGKPRLEDDTSDAVPPDPRGANGTAEESSETSPPSGRRTELEEVFSDAVPSDPPAAMANAEKSSDTPPPSEGPPPVEAVPMLPPSGGDPPPSHQVFTIAWTVHPIVRQVRSVWMSDATRPIFFARPTGRLAVPFSWLITERDVAAPPTPAELIGVLARGRSSLLTRRWVLRCGDNEELGFAFYDINGWHRAARAFRLVIPLTTPYHSTSPEGDLSGMARAGHVDDDFLLLGSRLPVKKPNGRVALPFGANIIVQPSVKNFIVEDADGRQVFVIYKSSDGACTVRAMPPITPLLAFALGVAIVTTAD